jgi:2-polyprenyl-3-methyl-5-hydroxy-6-metoxy-1,4-benzoquinol methylase
MTVPNHIAGCNESEPINSVTDLLSYSEAEVERWDREWLNYIFHGYRNHFTPYTAYPFRPELPEDPLETLNVSVGREVKLGVYAPGSAICGKSIMEFGCGCGLLGKLIAHYALSYLGVDCSRLALAIGPLVSPANATYLHVNQSEELSRLYGTVDTLVSRFFWIHQNFETGRRVLRIVEPLLKSGGRLYLDFFWPNPAEAAEGTWSDVWKVYLPQDALSEHPSALFQYSAADVAELFRDMPFQILHQVEHGPTQRRYVTAEKVSQ